MKQPNAPDQNNQSNQAHEAQKPEAPSVRRVRHIGPSGVVETFDGLMGEDRMDWLESVRQKRQHR